MLLIGLILMIAKIWHQIDISWFWIVLIIFFSGGVIKWKVNKNDD